MPKEGEIEVEQEWWKKKTLEIIGLTIEDKIILHVHNITNLVQMWQTLKDLFEQHNNVQYLLWRPSWWTAWKKEAWWLSFSSNWNTLWINQWTLGRKFVKMSSLNTFALIIETYEILVSCTLVYCATCFWIWMNLLRSCFVTRPRRRCVEKRWNMKICSLIWNSNNSRRKVKNGNGAKQEGSYNFCGNLNRWMHNYIELSNEIKCHVIKHNHKKVAIHLLEGKSEDEIDHFKDCANSIIDPVQTYWNSRLRNTIKTYDTLTMMLPNMSQTMVMLSLQSKTEMALLKFKQR